MKETIIQKDLFKVYFEFLVRSHILPNMIEEEGFMT